MRFDVIKNWKLKEKEPGDLQKRALRGLGIFMVCMIFLTLLSRAAGSLTIPQVEMARAESGVLSYKIEAAGQVEENQALAVSVVPGIRVAGISVQEGDKVKPGDTLFQLDVSDLEEQTAEKKKEIEKIDLGIRDTEDKQRLDKQNSAAALERSREDYNQTAQTQDEAVGRAYEAMEEAEQRINQFRDASGEEEGEDLVMERLEADCREKEEIFNQAGKRLEEIEAGKGEESDGLTPEEKAALLEEGKKALESAEEEKEAADSALEQYKLSRESQRGQEDSQQLQALEDAYRQAKNAYEDAVSGREKALTEAERQIADAGKPQASDSSTRISRLDKETLQKELQKLEKLLEQKGIVTSQVEGTVLEVGIETGNDTLDGRNMSIADLSKGCRFTAQITREEKKLVSTGDEITLVRDDGKASIKGLTVKSVLEDKENPGMEKVTVLLEENQLEIGSTATMKIEKRSSEYACTVPVEALRMEDNRFFVLIPRKKDTMLGSELTADKVYVEVLEKDESMAALDESGLSGGQSVITESSRDIKAGDRIRLKEDTGE